MIVEAVDRQQVFLFGSRDSSGDTGASDIDLFLQVETGRDAGQIAAESYKTIRRLEKRPLVGIHVVIKDTAFGQRFGQSVGSVVGTAHRSRSSLRAAGIPRDDPDRTA